MSKVLLTVDGLRILAQIAEANKNPHGFFAVLLQWAEQADAEIQRLRPLAAKYDALNTPEIKDFLAAVEREALHQRNIHAHKGDAGKSDADWFWLLGYLGGKALHAGAVARADAAFGNRPESVQAQEKQLHHIITTAAACLNWHAARVGTYQDMRPGIAAPGEPT